MVKKILLAVGAVLLVLVVGFVVVVAMQPNHYRVERSAVIAAPPATVFEHVNDFHKWDAWSPWAKLDPDAKITFAGEAAGTGAIFRWAGNDKVGEGGMTITESRSSDLIRIKLDFVKPFEDTCDVEFDFKPVSDGTKVTWSMEGDNNNFTSKAMCLVMNMDKMIGSDYEKGLASMKEVVEKASKNEPAATTEAPSPE